ncbi:MAG: nitroreductase family protein [Thermoflexales bacterium]
MSAIFQRRSIRRYTAEDVPDALVWDVLTAALRAPSPHNRQPWRFAVLRGQAREVLAHAMGEQLRQDLQRDGLPAAHIAREVTRSRERITGAPVCILACLTMRDMDTYPDARRNACERWMAGQAVAAAVQNLLLRATELGLGASWMCAPLFCPETVRTALKLPADWEPQALITLGHPAETGRERPRKLLTEVTLWLG